MEPIHPLVGVISDTHGLLRSEALIALRSVDHIIHAGDVGGREILEKLESIAPVTVVRGNTDGGAWAREMVSTAAVEVGGVTFYVLHDLLDLDLSPQAAGFDAVIFGHTHEPELREDDGVLFLNPGSAGPIRGEKPVSLALVEVKEGRLRPKFVTLV